MENFFGVNRTVRPAAQIASSEYAAIKIGSGGGALGQRVQGTYTRQIQTIFEIGQTDVYWIAGRDQGSLSFDRLVGGVGFYSGWSPDECGMITPVAIDTAAGQCVAGAGGLRFDGCMIENLTFGMNAGSLEINEGVTMRVASMNRSS